MPRCAISIDVDPVPCYYRIHGLGTAPAALRHVIMARAVPRFLEVFERRGIAATFFFVAGDLDARESGPGADAARAMVGRAAECGHEIGNHSFTHPYELARLERPLVAYEIERAHQLLQTAAGTHVVGFRAPGYDISSTMLAELTRLGYRYDSSIFPAPAYYAAKLAVMAGLWAARRPSGAVVTNPRALFAPAEPYRPDIDAPWRSGRASLVELPISVTPLLRVPAIGTSLLLAPAWLRAYLMAAVARRRFFNFELHGIDLADARADGIPAELCARQPDLRIPLDAKLARFEAVLDAIQARFELVRLCDEAERVQGLS